jgi:hypothetical protein
MYLCHINFRPVDGAQLIYSALADPEHVRAHVAVPADLPAADAARLRRTIERINADPAVHHRIDPQDQCYDPEVVMTIKYLADASGYAHSLQKRPQGDAFYVAHRIAELPLVLRWIARTGDEDALGMVLPATAEHLGRERASRDGMMKTLAAGDSVCLSMKVGYLDAAATAAVEAQITAILNDR